ncbi:DgyrCDS3343 [Dimorphilus gyrociliatus]|uniref:DgyrCDS3343 n=1 Tax=Dimorphilus gyrociliatus TaxID=2664684 RepID=A0A7I8VEQ7_9ANNE|nr:DgyrCDS3343 [Dimorphilus gyrociliatus]
MKNVIGSFKDGFLSSTQELNRTEAENKSILEQSLSVFVEKYEQVLLRSYKNLQDSILCKQSNGCLRNEAVNQKVKNEDELKDLVIKLYDDCVQLKSNEINCARDIISVTLKFFSEYFANIEFYERSQMYLRSNLIKPLEQLRQSCTIFEYRLQIMILLETITIKKIEKPNECILRDECCQIIRLVESICFREPPESFQILLKTLIENYGTVIPQYIAFIFEEIGQPVPEKLLALPSSPNDFLSDTSPPPSSSTIGSETAFFSDQCISSHDSKSSKNLPNHKRSFTASSHHVVKLPVSKLSRSQSVRQNRLTTPKKRLKHNPQNYKTPPRRQPVLKTKSVKETPLRKQKSGSVKRQQRSRLVATPEARRVKCIEESPILGDETKRNLLEKRFSAPTNLSKRQLFSPVKTSNRFDLPQTQEPAKRIENVRRMRNIVI